MSPHSPAETRLRADPTVVWIPVDDPSNSDPDSSRDAVITQVEFSQSPEVPMEPAVSLGRYFDHKLGLKFPTPGPDHQGDGMADSLAVLGEWQAWLRASYAPKTGEFYWRVMTRFITDTATPLDQVKESDCAAWLERWPFRSSARRSYYNGLRCFFDWSVAHGYITENPLGNIRIVAPKKKVPRALSIEEYEAVKLAAYKRSPMRGYAVELLYYSAGRITEVLELRWEDVSSEGIIFKKTKGGKERRVPWNPGLMKAVTGLRGFFGSDERVLPRTQQTVWLWVKQAGNDAGIRNVHPHLFRSTAATRMLVNGARPHAVQNFLGHESIKTTQVYWAVEEEDVKEAGQLL